MKGKEFVLMTDKDLVVGIVYNNGNQMYIKTAFGNYLLR